MAPRPLLFISPVMPAPTGSGIAMRAFNTVRALASGYRVHVLVAGASLHRLTPPEELETLTDRVLCVPLRVWREPVAFARATAQRVLGIPLRPARETPSEWRVVSAGRVRAAATALGRTAFDVVFVFRLYCTPFAAPFTALASRQLDLDDVESVTRSELARLCRGRGMLSAARRWEQDSARYQELERRLLPGFDRVFVASPGDREALAHRGVCDHPEVLPNVVTVPRPSSPGPADAPFTFLFVGGLAYEPNRDALLFLCEDILPRLRARADRAFRVDVVGSGLGASQRRQIAAAPELRLSGHLAQVAPAYRRSHAVVIPVRAGGGTRIKTLEAFAHCRAVVATPKGVEGLAVCTGEHVLVGPDPEAFAEHCARLMKLPEEAGALAQRAYRFVERYHDPGVLTGLLLRRNEPR